MKTDIDAHRSTAGKIRRRILGSRDRIWRIEDFEGSGDAIQAELRRLVRAGELDHVRRGVYWRGRKTRFGMTPASEGRVLRELLGRHTAIGAAGWYAANLLGLSTQVSPIEVLAITSRPPAGFPHLKLIDRSGRLGRRDERLNELEVTILEALEGWETYVEEGAEKALVRFRDLIVNDDVRVVKLAAAAYSEPALVRERLRHLLLFAGMDTEADRIQRAKSIDTRRRALSVFPELTSTPATA